MSEALTQPIGKSPTKPSLAFSHIDDFLDDDTIGMTYPELAYPHFLFDYWRKPAVLKAAYAPFMRRFKLFVDYEGKTWRVVGASRLGDIWLSENFDRDHGYNRRVDPDFTKFSNWRDYVDRNLTWRERLFIGYSFYGLGAIPGLDTVLNTSALPKICNKYTSALARAGAPKQYLDCTAEERAFLLTIASLSEQ